MGSLIPIVVLGAFVLDRAIAYDLGYDPSRKKKRGYPDPKPGEERNVTLPVKCDDEEVEVTFRPRKPKVV